MSEHGRTGHHRPPPATTTPRHCLRCERPFASTGAHHRLCQTCRQVLDQGPSPARTYRVRGRGPDRGL